MSAAEDVQRGFKENMVFVLSPQNKCQKTPQMLRCRFLKDNRSLTVVTRYTCFSGYDPSPCVMKVFMHVNGVQSQNPQSTPCRE